LGLQKYCSAAIAGNVFMLKNNLGNPHGSLIAAGLIWYHRAYPPRTTN
jgi:hypothetical protein